MNAIITRITHPPFTSKLWAHLWALPRWFASPLPVLGVTLGALLAHAGAWPAALSALTAVLVMAAGHSGNAVWDWVGTGLDKGETHSRPKVYTSGQNVIGAGTLSVNEAGANMMVWVFLSGIVAGALALITSHPWVMAAWAAGIACGPAYSYAKLVWLPEATLFLGFGLIPPVLGALAADNVTAALVLRAAAAGIPFGLLFGFSAEILDQALDADAGQWDKHLRSIGPWLVHTGLKTWPTVMQFVILAGMTHALLAIFGVLSAWSLLALLAIPFAWVIAPYWDNKRDFVRDRAIMMGLGCLVAYCVLTVIGQAVGG